MDGSAELYAELLGRIEELLPSVADEIRRDVDRGGHELDLFEPHEMYVFGEDFQDIDGRGDTHRRDPLQQYSSRGKRRPARPDRIEQFRQQHLGGNSSDAVSSLSGDGRLAILLDAVITLLTTVNGSESELTGYLRQKGVRSVTFGAAGVEEGQGWVFLDEIDTVADRRAEVVDALLTARAVLEGLQ